MKKCLDISKGPVVFDGTWPEYDVDGDDLGCGWGDDDHPFASIPPAEGCSRLRYHARDGRVFHMTIT